MGLTARIVDVMAEYEAEAIVQHETEIMIFNFVISFGKSDTCIKEGLKLGLERTVLIEIEIENILP